MKSTTCQKQTATSSMSATTLISTSDAARHHRHHHNHCQPNGSAGIEGLKPKLSDANNNDNDSVMTATTTTTVATKAKMPTMTNPGRSKNGEKYSLRQRQRRSFAVPTSAATVASLSSALKSGPALVESVTASTEGFSGYTTSVKRFNTLAVPSSSSSSKEKAKSKAAPLSKYRRKTANARERTRMREINSAFENLRRCVPHTITGDETTSSNEKLTKITTLRLAMKYIRVLSEALENTTFQENFLLECKNDGDHRFTTRDWVQPLEITDHSEQEQVHPTTTVPVQPRPKAKKSKMQMTKVFNKRQRTKAKIAETLTSYLTSSSTFSSPLSSSSSSAYVSMSPSPLLDDCHSMTDLSSMILESDGESLHLSEPCLSPLSRHYNPGIHSFDGAPSILKTTPTAIAIENPLELSLRLLEPDGDSLEFATEQPSSCISPLATLESFNPFGDLLHTDFSEHNSLDLFLT